VFLRYFYPEKDGCLRGGLDNFYRSMLITEIHDSFERDNGIKMCIDGVN
jgi:hypothetical protein